MSKRHAILKDNLLFYVSRKEIYFYFDEMMFFIIDNLVFWSSIRLENHKISLVTRIVDRVCSVHLSKNNFAINSINFDIFFDKFDKFDKYDKFP
jgi:hypothetical protein